MTDTPTSDEAGAGDEQAADTPAADTPAADTPAESEPAAEAPAPGTGPDVPADEPIAISATIGTAEHKPIKDRLLLPLLVPILSAIAVGMLAVNISRVFLAGSSQAALFVAIFVTLGILGGASLLAAAPHLRTSSLAVIVVGVFVVIMGAGMVTLGPSLGHDEEGGGCEAPTGEAVGQIDVEALASIKFDKDNYDAPPGIVDIRYFGAPGHTLAFKEPGILCVELATPGPPSEEKVLLDADTTYDIYCTIPGHEAAGMVATVTVGAA